MRRESIKVGGRADFSRAFREEERVDWLTPLHYGEIFVTVKGQRVRWVID